jgi:hypothetical protein
MLLVRARTAANQIVAVSISSATVVDEQPNGDAAPPSPLFSIRATPHQRHTLSI